MIIRLFHAAKCNLRNIHVVKLLAWEIAVIILYDWSKPQK